MKVVLFGGTGMIGSGALLECLEHPDVEHVLVVGRRPSGVEHERVSELVHHDFHDFSAVVDHFRGYDACFYCLGVTSSGMTEDDYRRITVGVTVAACEALREASPGMSVCFVSGMGSDSTERGRVMWARVKGEAENAVLGMGFGAAWIFRPGYVQPRKGVRSRTALYNAGYAVVGWLYPLLRHVRGVVTNTELIGLALIRAARDGGPSEILECRDINDLGEAEAAGLQRRS